MKKLSFIILALLVTFAFVSAAFAYDDLITNDTAVVKEAGSLCAKASLLYLTASDTFDKDGEKQELADDQTHLRVPLKVRYGIMDKLEAFAILPIVSKDVLDFTTGKTDSESGIGDIWLGVKYSLLEDNLLTLRGALDIPLADEEKGLGEYDGFGIDVGALTQYMMDAICLNGQVGIRYSGEEGDTDAKWKPGLGIYLDGEASYGFSDVLSAQAGLEIFFIGEGESDGTSIDDSNVNGIELNIGASYKIADNMALKGDIIYTITGTNINASMGILLSFGYGFSF